MAAALRSGSRPCSQKRLVENLGQGSKIGRDLGEFDQGSMIGRNLSKHDQGSKIEHVLGESDQGSKIKRNP